MKWYLAQMVFCIEKRDTHEDEFDLQWRMIQAESEADALVKAEELGAEENCTFRKATSATVAWTYVATTQLYPFDAQQHGAQLCSYTESPVNAKAFEASVFKRAELLKSELKVEELT